MPTQKSDPLLGWQSPSKNYIFERYTQNDESKNNFPENFWMNFSGWNFLDAIRNGLRPFLIASEKRESEFFFFGFFFRIFLGWENLDSVPYRI